MGFLAGGKPKRTQPAAVNSLQLQSSTYGAPIPIIFGTTRTPPNLIWYGDLNANPQSNSGGKGGPGSGGGKTGGGGGSYFYDTSLIFALCEGPIIGIGNVFKDKAVIPFASAGMSSALGAYGQAPWGYLTNRGITAEQHTVPGSPYQVTVSKVATFNANVGVVFVPSVTQYTRQYSGSPGPNQYAVSRLQYGSNVYTFNSANAGYAVIIQYVESSGAIKSQTVLIPSSGPYAVTIQNFGYSQDHGVTATNTSFTQVGSSPGPAQYTVSDGTYTFNSANAAAQVTIYYTALDGTFQALGYSGIAYAATAAYPLGNSAQLSNHNFEVKAIHSYDLVGGTIPDADPSLVVTELLTNAHFGAGFPAARMGSLTTYQAYCIANGLWISPAYNAQAQVSAMLDEIAQATNSEFVWSSGALTLVPRGDQTVTANGYTYTAPSAPLYDLDDDDFVSRPGEDPVQLMRRRPADAINSVKLECLDRGKNYNPAVIEAKDQAMIDAYGLRQSPARQTYMFCDLAAGRLSAQLFLQKEAVRNRYRFTLDQRYVLLDPMDIVTITDTRLGLAQQWVRILTIDENDDGTLDITAEEYLNGTGSAPAYSFQGASGFEVDYNGSPDDANEPVIFEAPVEITQSGLEVWLAASGGANWGGCDVWISTDGDTYKMAGRMTGPCRQGELSALLASGSDPDTSNTLSVDLSQSRGQLLSGTQADADGLRTLCYVDGELIAYQTATLTAQYEYDLTYLRRGCYGTTISSHASGAQFARLDDGIFALPYDKSLIGTTIYVKLLSFNIYGGGLQQLSDVAAYPVTLEGPPKPGTVQGFQAQQTGNVVAFRWEALPNEGVLRGYDIAYAEQGETDWGKFILLTEAARGTEMTNASVPPGTWTFAIRARDIADQLSETMSTLDLTITNEDEVILSKPQQPDWDGFGTSAFVKHHTGPLVPESIFTTAAHWEEVSAPDGVLSLFQVPGGSMSPTTYYVKITYQTGPDQLYADAETTPGTEESLAVDEDNLLSVDCASSAPIGVVAYNVYAGTSSGVLTKQNTQPIPLGTPWTMPVTGLIAGDAPPTRNSTGWEVFDIFVPAPNFNSSYYTSQYDTGFDDSLRVWMSRAAVPGPGQSGQPSQVATQIATRLTADPGWTNFIDWTIGTRSLRYVQGLLIVDWWGDTATVSEQFNPGNVCYFTDFTLTVDGTPEVESVDNVVVAPGGTTVTFPQQFHLPPFVQATVVGTSARTVTVSGITETQCTFQVWDSDGNDVGGTVNYTATGE